MRKITYAEAINEAIREEMRLNEKIILLGEDIGVFGGVFKVTKGLIEEFGRERVIDTPISESAIAGSALGMSLMGLRPIAEIMWIDFMTVAMDQIVNQAAKFRYMFGGQCKVPLVIRTQEGGGRYNGSQHSQALEAWFVHVPGLLVVVPSTPYDAKGLLKTAIRDDNPVIFIEHKLLYRVEGEVPEDEYLIPFGKADIKREGKDVTLVATSRMVYKSLSVAEKLAKDGISVEVIDPRTLVPLDIETIKESVKKTGKLVIVHEASKRAGIGAEIGMEVVEEVFDYLDASPKRVAALDTPIPYSPNLENYVLPDEEKIEKAIREVLKT